MSDVLYSRSQVRDAIDAAEHLLRDEVHVLPRGSRLTRLLIAAVLALLDDPDAPWEDVLTAYATLRRDRPGTADEEAPQYSAAQASAAVNAGVDLVGDRVGEPEYSDLKNLVVNTVLELLEDPGASLEEVALGAYGESSREVLGWIG
ncbi:hypothetical protein RM574_25730 [Streptomyces sp. DSM 41982]|uniref:Uncharacterized protein n=1 Tax=Streptomyces evansiae TaxID=3075535 RepID=A0ABD5ECT6_9ACTN|nr:MULTISPECIES: hypothetical protein [unclassified Streptomyces]MDT0418886.1 hypothetical protein [Streptomyces sp. DSM 41982]SCE05001.1 hypothetical protein GA0115246_109904 [Streptomyces sp. SolWspMP-sol7th]